NVDRALMSILLPLAFTERRFNVTFKRLLVQRLGLQRLQFATQPQLRHLPAPQNQVRCFVLVRRLEKLPQARVRQGTSLFAVIDQRHGRLYVLFTQIVLPRVYAVSRTGTPCWCRYCFVCWIVYW